MGGALQPVEVEIRDRRLSPAEAEVWVTVRTAPGLRGAEVRGRLVGPRCLYATTVEVAYPLRPLPQPVPDLPEPTVRVVIPEPSLWDPQTPFLYQGMVELWREGQRCDGTSFRHGLRDCRLGAQDLRWNGRPLSLRGTRWQPLPTPLRALLPEQPAAPLREELRRLRGQGFNLLAVAAEEGSDFLWTAADEVGFLILYQLADTAFARRLASGLARHPCALGWVAPPDLAAASLRADLMADCGPYARRVLWGAELDQPPAGPLPGDIQFVLCGPELLPRLADLDLPKIVTAAYPA